jgi:hypothetical protein
LTINDNLAGLHRGERPDVFESLFVFRINSGDDVETVEFRCLEKVRVVVLQVDRRRRTERILNKVDALGCRVEYRSDARIRLIDRVQDIVECVAR